MWMKRHSIAAKKQFICSLRDFKFCLHLEELIKIFWNVGNLMVAMFRIELIWSGLLPWWQINVHRKHLVCVCECMSLCRCIECAAVSALTSSASMFPCSHPSTSPSSPPLPEPFLPAWERGSALWCWPHPQTPRRLCPLQFPAVLQSSLLALLRLK